MDFLMLIRGRSVQTNLTSFVSDLCQEIDSGHQVDAVYTDLSSAFDRVDHDILLQKLEGFGLHGSLLAWFDSYLRGRVQTVVLKGFMSRQYPAYSGVPQGSHLGPLLFLANFDDVTKQIVHCKFSLFADDLKIYKRVDSISDAVLVQSDLDRISNWSTANKMVLNVSKCQSIHFTRKIVPFENTYYLDGQIIQKVNKVNDLGVLIDNRLRFTEHVEEIVSKSMRMLSFVRRNTKEFSTSCKIIIFNSLVRSILEYASIVWNPTYTIHSQKLELVQRVFTKYLAYVNPGISHRVPYENRLEFFGMDSLFNRRRLLDVLFLHKLLSSKIECSDLLNRVSLNVPFHPPRYPITKVFSLPLCRTNVGQHSPLVRVMSEFNLFNAKIPDLDIFNDSLVKVKRRISDLTRPIVE